MSDQKVSIILFSITAAAGLICGFLRLYIFIPIFPGVIIGSVAGYFYEKHRVKQIYDEPFFFRMDRLSFTGAIAGTFLSLVFYQLVTWMVE